MSYIVYGCAAAAFSMANSRAQIENMAHATRCVIIEPCFTMAAERSIRSAVRASCSAVCKDQRAFCFRRFQFAAIRRPLRRGVLVFKRLGAPAQFHTSPSFRCSDNIMSSAGALATPARTATQDLRMAAEIPDPPGTPVLAPCDAAQVPAPAGADLLVPIPDPDPPERSTPLVVPFLHQIWHDNEEYISFKLELFLSGSVTAMDHLTFWFSVIALVYQVYRTSMFFAVISDVHVIVRNGGTRLISNAIFIQLIFGNIFQILSIFGCIAWLGMVLFLRRSDLSRHCRSFSGILSRAKELALAWKQSINRELLFDSATLLYTLSACLQLYAQSSAGACSPDTTGAELYFCIPAGGNLPSGRVFLVFIAPIITQSVFHVGRVRIVLLSWLLTCLFVFASAVRNGDLAFEIVHILSALLCLLIILRMDQFGRECYVVHIRELALQDAARRLELAESRAVNARLEIEVLKTEVLKTEASSKEICTLMGNVAHDLKTPIQAISTGLELLRYLLCLTCVI